VEPGQLTPVLDRRQERLLASLSRCHERSRRCEERCLPKQPWQLLWNEVRTIVPRIQQPPPPPLPKTNKQTTNNNNNKTMTTTTITTTYCSPKKPRTFIYTCAWQFKKKPSMTASAARRLSV